MDESLGSDLRWRRMRRLSLSLLLVWAIAGFGLVYFARSLNSQNFLGWPLGFWIAAQGALLIFLLIVVVYAWAADRNASSD
ncbi:MAG: DUF4212 domain-containing protein [Paucibacter sp.]|nr:DUF4212 domain-containing protein [Roseateles sp.]